MSENMQFYVPHRLSHTQDALIADKKACEDVSRRDYGNTYP